MRRTMLAGLTGLVLLSACADDGPDHSAGIRPHVAGEIVLTDVVCPPIDGYAGPVADRGVGAVADGTITVDAGDFYFSPTCSVHPSGGTVSMTLTNSGGILHNVSVAEQGIDIDIPPGQTVVVDFAVGDEPLTYVCKYHRTAGMVGALIPISESPSATRRSRLPSQRSRLRSGIPTIYLES